jgi:hypothetical protein
MIRTGPPHASLDGTEEAPTPAGEHAQIANVHMHRGHADSAEGVSARSGKGAHSTYDGNPLGWRAHGRNARGQADHEELAHMLG